jgi:hypothetical protein
MAARFRHRTEMEMDTQMIKMLAQTKGIWVMALI